MPLETSCIVQVGDMGTVSRQRCLETAEGLVSSQSVCWQVRGWMLS